MNFCSYDDLVTIPALWDNLFQKRICFNSNLFMIYPCDAKTIPFSLIGTTTSTLLNATDTPRTILNVDILNYAYNVSQSSWITCGDVKIAEGYYKEGRDYRDMIYPCSAKVEARNVGSVNSNGQIVYVDRNINLATALTCEIQPTIASIENGFTYGEIVNSIWLILIFSVIIYAFFYFSTRYRKK